MDLERRLGERADALTPSERRIGETILANPQLVAFGTVADVAEAARVGTATVVRFAVKLGFDGYSQLQASVQGDGSKSSPASMKSAHEPAGNWRSVVSHTSLFGVVPS